MSFSDLVPLFSSTSNIVNLTSYTTTPVILGEYVSLTISIYSTEILNCSLEFSNDGKNFDITETFNSTANSPFWQSSPVLGKYTRFVCSNSSGNTATSVRIYCYGSPTNIVNQSILTSIGGEFSQVEVANLPITISGYNETTVFTKETGYNFQACCSGALLASFLSNYGDLALNSSNAVDTIFSQGNTFVGLQLPNIVLNSYVSLSSSYIRPVLPGVNYHLTMSASFNSAATYNTFVGVANHTFTNAIAGNVISEGLGFSTSNNSLAITYVVGGVTTTVLKALWNVDKFDGTQANLNINYANINRYAIYYSIGGHIIFAIQDTDGKFKPCHIINNSSVNTLYKDYSFVCMVSGLSTNTSSGNLVSLCDWSVLSTDNNTVKEFPFQNIFQRTLSGAADNTFHYMATIKNTQATLFGNKKGKVLIKNITYYISPASAFFGNTAHVMLSVSKNSTLTGASFVKNISISNAAGKLVSTDTSASVIAFLNQIIKREYLNTQGVYNFTGRVDLNEILYDDESISLGFFINNMVVNSDIIAIFNYTEEY